MQIITYSNLSRDIQSKYLEQIKDIFFSCSSVKKFKDEHHKESFFNKWCGDYLKIAPEFFYLYIIENSVTGYLSGFPNSYKALEELLIPGPEVFTEYFEKYPAHFHINCSPHHQGKGIGRKLVEHFIHELNNSSIDGVHLITSTDANNLGFYRALGFEFEIPRPYKSHELLLMGRENVA